MFWESPTTLLALWLLPLVAAVLYYAHRKRVATARQFADPAMVARLMPVLDGPRPWVKGSLVLLGLAMLIVAAARPRFGVYYERVAQRGVDLFVLLDVSRSMTAEDVAPNRLERAKSDIRDLLGYLVGDRVGLIVFAGKPMVSVPLTSDHGFLRSALDQIDVSAAPLGGTFIGDAIRKAMEAMPRARDRDQVLVLITDGEDHDSYALEAAKQAAERGIKIFTVGLGDAKDGARIPIRDSAGRVTYLQDSKGQVVWSKVNETLLQEIALATQGAYIPAGTRAYDLGKVYDDRLAQLTRSEYQAEKRKRYGEQFQWFVCLGLALLLLEMAIPSYAPGTTHSGGQPTTIARGSAAAILVMLFLVAPASASTREAAEKVRQGISYYESGDYGQSAEAFQSADVAQPDDLRITFDRGVALAAKGDHEKAIELLKKSALSPQLDLAVQSRYNLGCIAVAKAKARFGEHPEEATPEVRKEGLQELAVAVQHFRDCLQTDKDHADARHNLELVRLWIKHMQSLWEQRDRQKQREEMDLADYIRLLEEQQRALRAIGIAIGGEADTPKRRQAQREVEQQQRTLAEEIEPLKEKIAAALEKAAQTVTDKSDEIKKAIQRMQNLADEAGKVMLSAADALRGAKPAEATPPQTEAVAKLDQLYRAVASYPQVLQRALATQQALVGQAASQEEQGFQKVLQGWKDKLSQWVREKTGSPSTPAPKDGRPAEPQIDPAEAAWHQEFVTRYTDALLPLAKAGLEQLKQEPAGPAPPPGTKDADAEAAQKEQREGLRKSLEKAVELGPKVRQLSSDAVALLRDKKAPEASPKQQEALKLLKEIAEPLPKQQPQQQNDQKQDQNKQDQQQQQPDQQQGQKQEQDQKQQQLDISQQEAEAAMRRAEERQQQRQELERERRQYYSRPGKVEKDW